jgi:hypothetical protein
VSDPAAETQPAAEIQPVGWQVLHPDGHVVAAGPPTTLEAATDAGEEN